MAARATARRAAEQTRLSDSYMDGHRQHHGHLMGTGVYCSCGRFEGITCVAFDDEYPPSEWSCSECGARDVVLIGPVPRWSPETTEEPPAPAR